MSANYAGRPLSVLSSLIRERGRILKESAKDAVIATGIDALVSLRALTKTAPKKRRRGEYLAEPYTGREKPHYLTKPGGRVMHRWNYTLHPGTTDERRYVKYIDSVRNRRNKANLSAERRDLVARMAKIKHRGLAKWALGVAMNKLSTRPVIDKVNVETSKLANAKALVSKSGNDNMFMLQIVSALDYSVAALKNGSNDVDLALKRAANKIAGRLSKVAEKTLGERIATPFPEVRQRRS